MNEKWILLYQPKLSYAENLKILNKDFEKMWNDYKPSQHGEVTDEYEFLYLIGKGSFGTVVASKCIETKNILAIKILLKEKLIVRKQIDHSISEKKILHCICFPFLIYLEFSLKNNNYLFLGLPYIDGGDLFIYLRTIKRFKEDDAKFYASQVVLALEYLHNSNILYRDLKPENLLLDNKGYLKLTDLGFAKKVETRTYTFCGTPEYFAPELINLESYGKSVDWWAFGILIYEFVAGQTPFVLTLSDEISMFERIHDVKYSIPNYFTHDLKNLIHHLLQKNVSKRFGCMKNGPTDIKSHKWFKNINWISILNREYDPYYVPQIKSLSNYPIFPKGLQNIHNYDKYAEEFKDF